MNQLPMTAQLTQWDTERMKSYKNALEFYHGNQWEGRTVHGEKRLTFNYSKVFIDKITSYLMSGVSFAIDPVADSAESRAKAQRAETLLQQVYQDNNLEQLDLETEIDAAILGDACYKVTWDEAAKRVRVTAPDIQGIYAWWAGDDISHVWRVASRYSLSPEETGFLYPAYPKTKTAAVIEVWTVNNFELYLDDVLIEKKANPYGFIPFVIFPNLREPKKFWGTSDLTQIIEIQREMNRAVSQLARILELSGNPVAVLENIEESEDITVRPGAVWNIPEDAKAYLLDLLQGGGVNLHIDYINLLYRILHDISESPRAAFGGTERDLSGVALEIELQPLLQKVNRKRLIRTAAYNQRNRMILRLLEMYRNESFGENNLRVIWMPVLPKDIARQVANEQVLVQTGIHSRRHAMYELGIANPELEFRKWLEERENILKMNRELNAKPVKTPARERVIESPESIEE
ncbi:MAG: phage portal protein [Dehalococcoidales bacterium]|nr:phage portal protein [Dehalococcoidales bacterium]